MLGYLFVAFLVTVILGMLLATLHDEVSHVWRAFVDLLHPHPEEKKLKEIRRSLNNY